MVGSIPMKKKLQFAETEAEQLSQMKSDLQRRIQNHGKQDRSQSSDTLGDE